MNTATGIAPDAATASKKFSLKRWADDQPMLDETDVLNEISNFIFTSKYARYNNELKRRETWDEAVDRVRDMHLKKYNFLAEEQKREINWAFEMVRQKRVVPSMRSLQFGGAAVEAHNARMFNCSVRHVDSTQAFAELFYLLLCGCGVGIGLYDRFLRKIPVLIPTGNIPESNWFEQSPVEWIISDTIEGWADSLRVLIDSYVCGNEYSGRYIDFNYDLIRPKGTPLKTGGGKAPGSEGLRFAHEKIRLLLEGIVTRGIEKMQTIHAYDILMYASDAVLSGGIRRAAASVMFDPADTDMMNAKLGGWFTENPQRARSNNSAIFLRDSATYDEFDKLVKCAKQWGEPGFVFANDPDTLYNPCFEISFRPITKDGECGVQFCNLTSINGSKIKEPIDFYDCARAASIIGTLQAGYTDFPYLSKAAQKLTEEEALLGVSITAMMDNPDVLLSPERQRIAASVAVNTNKKWAQYLGINQAARVTCIKPEGSTTLVLGSMASGIHPSHSRQMFRRICANKLDNVYSFFRAHNPHLCEESVWSTTRSDDVITFPVEVHESALIKADLTAIKHLEIIKATQENWVLSGSTDTNEKNLNHNTSCTVVVQDDEWDRVIAYLFRNRKYFSAVSLLSASGDKDYQQAPMEAVVTDIDYDRFYWLKNNFTPVDYTLLKEDMDTTAHTQEVVCAGGRCEL